MPVSISMWTGSRLGWHGYRHGRRKTARGENKDKRDHTGSHVESLGWSSRVESSLVAKTGGDQEVRSRARSSKTGLIKHTAHSTQQ